MTNIQNRIIGSGDVDLDTILFNPLNWRIHPKHQQDALLSVLEQVGFVQNVIINKTTGNLVDGHLRCLIAQRQNQKTIPAVFIEVTPEEEKLILTVIDPIAGMAGTDKELLKGLLETIETDDDGIKTLMDTIALEQNIDFLDKPEIDDDDVTISLADQLQEKWQVQLGDTWVLGNHRLVCGDCTDRSITQQLSLEKKFSLIVTDPPYGVSYEGGQNAKKREALEGDENTDLFNKFLQVAPKDKDCALYIWHAGTKALEVYKAIEQNKFTVRAQIIWHKLKAHYGAWMAQYKLKHEPCLYCIKGTPKFVGATNENTVWEYDQPSRNEYHPTEKPIELMIRAISNHPYRDVYEPFAGSGTTLLACEQLDRNCYAIELSPAYCAVILERWSKLTGKQPIRTEGQANAGN